MADFNRLRDKDLGERYQINGVLGEGGLGVVYHAFDTILKIDVAIKTLQSESDGQGLVRLQREAMAAGKLKNENIARVFDFGQTAESSPYMVMELVQGISLAEFIKSQEHNRVDFATALPIFEQICLGLEHAHKNGIIHRDLKPSNVMLIEREHFKNKSQKYLVKLLDFGVAKIQSDQKLTTVGALLGSPLYMSPEQAQGDEVTVQSDIYSLGCLMFETLCGTTPFKGESTLETLSMHKNTAPPLVSEMIPQETLPGALGELIDKCLRKKAIDRPPDVESIRKQLEDIMGRNAVINDRQLELPVKNRPSPIKLPDWSHKSLFKFVVAASVIGVLALFFMYQHFQNTSLSKNVKLDETISKKDAETISPDLSNLVGKSNSFEYITSHRETTVETKKDTTDEDFLEIKNSYFVALKVKESNVTGSGFKYINKIPIYKIELRSDSIDPKYFSELLAIKTLTSLRIDKSKADANILSEICKFEKLEQLTLDSKLLQDKDFAILATLRKLKKLKVSGKNLTDNLIDYLTGYAKLETLDIENCKLMTDNLGLKIARIKTLKSLNLPCRQNTRSLEALRTLKLKDLDVSGLSFDPQEFDALCSMKSLKTLHMANLHLEGANYSKLKRLSNLQELDLSSEKVCNPALFAALASLNVKRIDLSKSDITPRELNVLIDNGQLDAINLDSCKKINKKIRKEFQRVYEKRWNRWVEMDFNQTEESELDQYNINPSVFDVPR
ncbi:MAG: serine/threonine-protein kinase [Candidatus Melainabacteria bacterium]|nr:serine/threonine-protein kinase [Candidatus Melainabacteria bacterium]